MIISVMGRKGGITKTTVTVNLAAALRLLGLRVLVVESDGQGNATEALGLQRRDDFYNLIVNDAEWEDLIREAPKEYTGKAGGLHLVSAYTMQRKVEEYKATPAIMYDRFKELRGVFDVVIGDTSPGITEVHAGWYYASDYILLPTLCDSFGVTSTKDMIEFIDQADLVGHKDGYPAAEVIGILPNRYSKGIRNSQFVLGELHGRFADRFRIFDQIRENPAWETGTRQHRSIYNLTFPIGERRLRMSARDARKEFEPVVMAVYETAKVGVKV